MDDDLNTSAALAAVFDFVRVTYQEHEKLSGGDAAAALAFVQEVDTLFAVLRSQSDLVDGEIQLKIEERQAARRRRDFSEADRIRQELLTRGIQLEDTRDGVRWKRIK
jgi:cysteinyl-tRNA synthetase